jgi:phosphoribosylglycinamide formyltransferase-1
MSTKRIVVLISGSGSNLQAIINACAANEIQGSIVAVISNRPEVYGLERARLAGIVTQTLDHKNFADRESFDQALMELIDSYQPDLVVLAGFMRILTSSVPATGL